MVTVERDVAGSPAEVFGTLSDGWLMGLWVVGAARIRQVDAAWPAIGSRMHHSVGAWPLLLDDTTSVTDLDPGRMLRLRARAWPAGEADVIIRVAPAAAGTRVTMTEDAISGPGRWIPAPVRQASLHWRNTESLRRLGFLTSARSAAAARTGH